MRKIIFILLFTLSASFTKAENDVPEFMEFCGMQLRIDDDARAYIQGVIDKLKSNPDRFNMLIERSDTYMPFVEEAFTSAGLPQDLKYIVLLESALQGDAVSTSNAVGFWQFKDFTAKEVGLEVNDQIDERMHISRSSVGAATYFNRLNNEFDNWIYAITGYNQGPRGALAYIENKYLGQNEMVITTKVHIYALKAIAHKLAFKDVIGKNPTPKIWLEPVSTKGETSVIKLAAKNETEKEKLLQYNLWIHHTDLPSSHWFTYYVPHENVPVIAALSDPNKELSLSDENPAKSNEVVTVNTHTEIVHQPKGEIIIQHPVDTLKQPSIIATDKKTDVVVEKTTDVTTENTIEKEYETIPITEYPGFGVTFIILPENKTLLLTAIEAKVTVYKIYEWNRMDPTDVIKPGTVLYLEEPGDREIHIAAKSETLSLIGEKYAKSESKLSKLNNDLDPFQLLNEGQVIYLKKKKPEGEKIIVLEKPLKNSSASLTNQKAVKNEVKKVPVVIPEKKVVVDSVASLPQVVNKFPEFETRMITHTVEDKETLWSISKKYSTNVDLIKKMNNLTIDTIHTGMKLTIMERIPKQ